MFKKITAYFGAIILIGIIGMSLALWQSDSKLLSVQSGSMVPALQKGDLIIVNSVPIQQLLAGDVITFVSPYNNKQTITHRIAAINYESGTIITKGDANKAEDNAINVNKVLGRVGGSVPFAGSIVDVVRQPIGLILLIYIPALSIIIHELKRLSEYYRKIKPYYASSDYEKEAYRKHPLNIKKFFVHGSVVVIAVVVSFRVGVFALLSTSATLASNSLSTVNGLGTVNVCQFPENESLLSYALIDVYFPELTNLPMPLQQEIPAGRYKITAVSYDNHSGHPNSPPQPNESWFLQLYGNSHSTVIYETESTTDIPYNLDETITIIAAQAQILEPIKSLRYVHNAARTGIEKNNFGGRKYDELSEQEKRQVVWNSVHPRCVSFEPIFEVQPSSVPSNN